MKMNRFLLFLVLFFIININVSGQSLYFNKRIDVTGDWDLCTSILTKGNNYLVAGDCGPSRHIYLSKIDSVGNLKWTMHYTASGFTYYLGWSGSLFQAKDNYHTLCGMRVSGPKGYGIVLKVDSTGNKKWEKEYQLLNYDNGFYSGNATKDSGYILTGDAQTGSTRYSYLLLKTDSLGNQQWFKTFTDNHPNRNYTGKSVIQTPDSGYCLGGGGGTGPLVLNIGVLQKLLKLIALVMRIGKKLMVILYIVILTLWFV
jgi:hypothetical protein